MTILKKTIPLLFVLLAIANLGHAANRPAKAILLGLKNQKFPSSLDYTILYQRWTKGKTAAELAKDSYLQHLEKEHRQKEKSEYLAKVTREQVLHQRQRLRLDGARVRYEVLEDLGSPEDPANPAEAQKLRLGRTATYFLYPKKTMVDVNAAERLVTILPSGFAYPNLSAYVKPWYSLNLEELLKRKDAQISSAPDGENTKITVAFGAVMRMEETVAIKGGLRLLQEEIFVGKNRTEYKKLDQYKKFGDYWIPMAIEHEAQGRRETISIEEIKINPALDRDVFDFTQVAQADFLVADARVKPPNEFKLSAGQNTVSEILKLKDDSVGAKETGRARGTQSKAAFPGKVIKSNTEPAGTSPYLYLAPLLIVLGLGLLIYKVGFTRTNN